MSGNRPTHLAAKGLWRAVRDERLDVGGRPVRLLRAEHRNSGDGIPQLLVHGLGGSSVTWVDVIPGLAEHGPVVAVDLPGFGRTLATDNDPLTIDGYVAFVLEVADALGWERFTLHGNSMGGLIATLLAAEHPERVEGLVLVSPALPPATPLSLLVPARPTLDGMLPILGSSVAAGVLGALKVAGPDFGRRRDRAMLGLIFSDPDGVRPELMDLMAEEFANRTPDEVSSTRKALLLSLGSITALWLAPGRVHRAVRAITAPTLLLGGTKDALVPARVLRRVLALRPDWDGAVIDDRRHALMLESPEEYLGLVATWVSAGSQAA